MDLVQAGKLTEEQAREYFERIIWPYGPVCPHCKGQSVGKLDGEKHRTGLYQCYNAECSQQFTVTVGTVLEDTHIPLQKWVLAFLLMNSSKKGISALQLKRNLGLGSYKTAWHMCHRIRLAMAATGGMPELEGEVEIDETYVGGKPRKIPGVRAKCGRGTKKTPVVALIQRNGPMRAIPVQHVTIKNLKNAIHQHVRKDANLMTDELPAYRKIGRGFASHKRVVHSRGEYAHDGVSVNSCESFFALLKRGVHVTFHHVSKKHLHRYCDEFSFRWEHRKATDGERTVRAIAKSSGKRLAYKQPKEAQ